MEIRMKDIVLILFLNIVPSLCELYVDDINLLFIMSVCNRNFYDEENAV